MHELYYIKKKERASGHYVHWFMKEKAKEENSTQKKYINPRQRSCSRKEKKFGK